MDGTWYQMTSYAPGLFPATKETGMHKFLSLRFCVALAVLAIVFAASLHSPARAAYVAEVAGAGSAELSIALADPLGSAPGAPGLHKYIRHNLSILPIANVLEPSAIPGGSTVGTASGEGIDFKKFIMAGTNILITTYWSDPSQVELRVFTAESGKFLFGNRYQVGSGDNALHDVADKFCGDLLEAIIGKGDFFRSTMAFIKIAGPRQRDVWAVKPNGRGLRQLTKITGEALSPSWSPDGRYVVFTHIDHRSHALGVWDAATGSTNRIRFPGNTVIGPSYMPDNRIAVSLTDGRNPSIFLLNHAFQKERKLDNSSSIDVSPSVDASGSKMAFASNRLGGPQIFVKDLHSGQTSRVSMSGSYNTDPSISPDGTMVAFARQVGAGQHRIVVHDLLTGREYQISNGPGSDEEPAFAPDGFFVAFSSTRGGSKQIYLTTRVGGKATRLPTGSGDASFPAWGAAR